MLIDSWLISTPNHITQATNGYNQSMGVVVVLMIFLGKWGFNWATYHLKWPIVNVNGQRYYLYGGIDGKGIYAASFFTFIKPGPIGSLDLEPFYAYLTSNKLIASSLHITDVQFGNEINQGNGTMTINSYSIQQ